MTPEGARAAARHRRSLARYYRWLDRLAWFRVARRETGTAIHPVHRALRDPSDAAAPPSPLLVHRLMLDGLALPAEPEVLDAGCGYGATAFDLQERLGGRWTGITLSAVQARRATEEAARRGLSDRLRFEVRSYDAPLPAARFDLVIGIESLIHSPDPAHTLANLAAALKPGGHMAMVDDVPEAGLDASQAADLALFRRMWRCPVAPGRDGWLGAMRAAGLDPVREQDLTALTLARDPAALAAPLARLGRRVAWLAPFGLGMRSQAELGGLALERLLHARAMRYRLIVARKPLPARAMAEEAAAVMPA